MLEDLIWKEIERQNKELGLIPSENYASERVLKIMGTPLSNKYAEGYPGKRYYQGMKWIDEIENYAIEMAKRLFKVPYANVQPHAGAIANLAVYLAFLSPGDPLMGMALDAGGHLTHGSKVNFSGKLYQSIPYTVDPETELLDYDEIKKLALAHKPKLIIAGYSAYPRQVDFKAFREIADEVGAILLADISHISGLVVAGEHPHPYPYADVITTTTHKTLRGPRGAIILAKEEYGKAIDKAVFPGLQGGPLEHVIAAKAAAFEEAQTQAFKEYAKQVRKNAKAMEETFKDLGYRLVSDGTDTHLLLIDLRDKGINGKEAAVLLEKNGIIVNANSIPFDPNPPTKPSGIRLGSPAITTRGMGEAEAGYIVELIDQALQGKDVSQEVQELTQQFPVYEVERWKKIF
ncbi:MAG: serine hydroxymethyltransferase [Candidatus Micrarchaeota archaeon]|nr:serine hydroxymethyltransferase [Candidatus Micrarchaeota archaeon]